MKNFHYSSAIKIIATLIIILLIFLVSNILYFGSYGNAGGKPAEAAITNAYRGRSYSPTNTSYKKVYVRAYFYADNTWGMPIIALTGTTSQITENSTYISVGWRCLEYRVGEDSVFSESAYTWSSSAPSSFSVRYKTASTTSSTYADTLWNQIQSGSYSTKTLYRYNNYLDFYSGHQMKYETTNWYASTSSETYVYYIYYLPSLKASYFTYATFTLKYNPMGGTVSPTSVKVTYNTTNVTPPTPSRPGYNFEGWYIGSTRYTGGIWQYTEQKTAIARWSSNIILDPQGGSGGSTSVTVLDGSVMTTATAPSRVGWLFNGYWSGTSGQGTQYYDSNMASTHTNDLVNNSILYAAWTPITYNILYNGNGATSGGTDSSSHTYDIAKNLNANGFVRTGYTFAGWATSNTGAVAYVDGQNVSNLTTINGGTVNLYAVWTPITYTITYDGNGNSSGSTANSTHTYNVVQNLTANGFIKTGYFFTGWATSSTGEVVYLNNQGVTNLSDTAGAIVTLYAKWTPISYTVSYNGNNNTSGNTANSTHIYDTAQNLTINGYIRTGYTFAGWATSSTGAVMYSNGQNVSNLSSTNSDTVVLYAVWTPITYIITYNGNGNTGGSTADSSHTYDIPKSLNATGFTKTGYHFIGWAISPSGVVAYQNADRVTNLADANNAIVILYAKWAANNYTVTFEYNGATGGDIITDKIVAFDGVYGDLPVPTKAGYNFKGWYLDNNYITQVINTTKVGVANNHTLYAEWKPLVNVYAVGDNTIFDYDIKFYNEVSYAKVIITPQTNCYVSEFSFDNVTYFPVKYFWQTLGNIGYCYACYSTSANNNKITLSFDCMDLNYVVTNEIDIYIKISNGTNNLLQDGVDTNVKGVNVTATYGGTARIVGDNFEDLGDSDTVTFVADVCVDGYEFSHWENSAGVNLGTDNSIKLTKSTVMDNIIKAVFVPVDTSLINGDKKN